MGTPSSALTLVDQLLLYSGIAATLVLVVMDRLAGALWKGYSFVAQSISQLSAPTAPTRLLALVLTLVYDALMIAFGAGLWRLAGQKRLLVVMTVFIIACAALQALVTLVFPMRIDNVNPSANLVNTILGALGMVCFLLAIGFGAAAFHGWFRWFSVAILAVYVVLTVVGVVVGTGRPEGAQASIGIQERTMVAGYLVWTVVLAVMVLRAGREGLAELLGLVAH